MEVQQELTPANGSAELRERFQESPEEERFALWRHLLTASCDESTEEESLLARLFVEIVKTGYNVLSLKTYRLELPPIIQVPMTPCLDHEMQMHEHELPHLGGYLQHWGSGCLLGFAYFPLQRDIWVEEETTDAIEEIEELVSFFKLRFPLHRVRVLRTRKGSAYARAREVAEAHVPLVSVLIGSDSDELQAQLSRLNGIASLMEKESRVSSWGIRTAYPPLIAAVAFMLLLIFPDQGRVMRSWIWGDWARLLLLVFVGGGFFYLGMKAVQLTKTATRLIKRIKEYEFILAMQKRFREGKGNLCVCQKELHMPTQLDAKGRESLEKALSLLEQTADETERLALLVKNRHRCASVLAERSIDARTPLFEAFCGLRLASIRTQRQATEEELARVEHQCHMPQHIEARANQRRKLAILDEKTKRLERFLALPVEKSA